MKLIKIRGLNEKPKMNGQTMTAYIDLAQVQVILSVLFERMRPFTNLSKYEVEAISLRPSAYSQPHPPK